MEILNNTDYDFNVWYNTYDPSFVEISAKSRIPDKWVNYERVLSGKYKDSVIKPINKYVEALYPPPKLVSIEGNTVTLRQHSHADIFLLEKDGKLKALDRPWMRQFYQSEKNQPETVDCFDEKFVAYLPWFLDANVLVIIRGVDGSPFSVSGKTDTYQTVPPEVRYLEPMMVPFRFKSIGEHMQEKHFGKVKRNTPFFDITFTADDTIIERVRDFYEKD
jgi:hypothetical protein